MDKHFDIEAAKRFQVSRKLKKQQKVEERYKQAKADFEKICNMVIERYKPKKMFQWGSLLNKKHFSEISDIDLAIEGITNAEHFFRLISDAQKLTDLPLDIVQIEYIHPLHRSMIEKNGKLIYQSHEC